MPPNSHPQDPTTRRQSPDRYESIYLLPLSAGSASVARSPGNSSRNGNSDAAVGRRRRKLQIVTIPAQDKNPQAATTSSFSSAGDTLTPVSDPQRPKPAMFKMRVGIRLQLGLLVLSACLVALMVLSLATWVGHIIAIGRTLC